MKVIIYFSIFLLGYSLNAQPSDIEIVQDLISKYHTNIRVELNSMGLTYTQKKQKTDLENTRYVFFIKGRENNTKTWEIYTTPVNEDKIRVVRILIKYYYKNQGDITELDQFILPADKLINGYFATFEKSEGKKQAHIDININDLNSEKDIWIKNETKYTKVLTNSKEKVYIQLNKNYKNTGNDNYFLNVSVMETFYCVGQQENYIKFKFFNDDEIFIEGDGAKYHCDFAAVSNFYLNDENIKKLSTNPVSIIQLKQGDHVYEIFVSNSNILIEMINKLGLK
jgi:hypothetical protein